MPSRVEARVIEQRCRRSPRAAHRAKIDSVCVWEQERCRDAKRRAMSANRFSRGQCPLCRCQICDALLARAASASVMTMLHTARTGVQAPTRTNLSRQRWRSEHARLTVPLHVSRPRDLWAPRTRATFMVAAATGTAGAELKRGTGALMPDEAALLSNVPAAPIRARVVIVVPADAPAPFGASARVDCDGCQHEVRVDVCHTPLQLRPSRRVAAVCFQARIRSPTPASSSPSSSVPAEPPSRPAKVARRHPSACPPPLLDRAGL